MAKFRDMKTLQKFAAIHASIHNHCSSLPLDRLRDGGRLALGA